MRTRTCIDFDWRFALGDFPAAIGVDWDDSGWRLLDLPHDWSIEATPSPDNPAGAGGGFYPGGIGWYRKRLDIPADLGDSRVLIEFDGVYKNSEVWCNGRFCGVRPYGYSSFCYDLTPCLRPGQPAVIAVRVDNSRQKNSRWYSGSGIYRHVWVTVAAPVRVATWGTFVTTPEVSAEKALVHCAVTLVNESGADADVEVVATVVGAPKTCCSQALSTSGNPATTDRRTVDLQLSLPTPRLWSPESPHLYTLRLELRRDGAVIDRYDTRFGVRTLRFDANEGFFLNGVSSKFKGVNEHHDAGCLGAAVPDDVLRRRLRLLKNMGCNAIRTAHNPASPTFLELCDELGFLVVEDAFDEWKDGKTPFGYQLDWDLWWERDLADMIRRDRNHACIALWSVGNEIKEVREGRPEGLTIMAALQHVCHREDPTRPMTCGCCNSRETLAAGYADHMDIFGYNGGGGGCFDYEKDHALFPNLPMFATEHPHTLQTRGVYRTKSWYRDLARNPNNVLWHPSPRVGGGASDAGPSQPDGAVNRRPPLELMRIPDLTEQEVFEGIDAHYQSSYGNAIVRMSILDSWYRTRTLPFFCGEFRWTGFDYLGECYGWPAKSWNFGILDLCGFPKDAYYFYQSQWTDAPMVHLLPHWTWPGLEGRSVPVLAYSNCDRVELFLDGVSLGTKVPDQEAMFARWDVPYRPGELKAAGYRMGNAECGMRNEEKCRVPKAECRRQNGPNAEGGTRNAAGFETAATCVVATAGEAEALEVVCEEATIRADCTGIAHVVVRVVDALGRFVPQAVPEVTVTVEGPGRLIGLENGDPIDTENCKLDHRRAFFGMLLAIVQADDIDGVVTIKVQACGLTSARCTVQTVTTRIPDGPTG